MPRCFHFTPDVHPPRHAPAVGQRVRPARAGRPACESARAADTPVDPKNPLAVRPAALRAEGQARHLPVHARRAVAGRYVRLQAAAGEARRQAVPWPEAARAVRADRQPARSRRGSSSQYGRVGAAGQRPVPARRASASTTCASSARCTPTTRRHGGALLELHTGSDTFVRPQHRLVGHLRPGHREPEPARASSPSARRSATAACRTGRARSCRPRTRGRRSATPGIPARRTRRSATSRTRDCRADLQRLQLDLLQADEPASTSTASGPDPALEGRIDSFELAFRMQAEAPDAAWTSSSETKETLRAVRHRRRSRPTTSAGSACWPAGSPRRACGSSRCTHSYKWDQHGDLKKDHAQQRAGSRQADRRPARPT